MKNQRSKVLNLGDFGLDLDRLLALGKRKVTLRARLRYPKEATFFSLSPDERKRKIDQWLREKFQSVKNAGQQKNLKSSEPKSGP